MGAVVIAVLALLDFIGDKIPVVDQPLHAVGMIVAPVAGAILFMATNSDIGGVSPLMAAICGVLIAGTNPGARATARPLATAPPLGSPNGDQRLRGCDRVVLSVLASLCRCWRSCWCCCCLPNGHAVPAGAARSGVATFRQLLADSIESRE